MMSKIMILAALLLTLGCGEGDTDTDTDTDTDADIAIAGSWTDGWGGEHVIDNESWAQISAFGDSNFAIVSFDNTEMVAIAQNDGENGYNPGLWSRFDWTMSQGSYWFCQTAYDAADQTAAEGTARADDTEPATSGCGGYAWSQLTPVQ